jgi:hypothetical protein
MNEIIGFQLFSLSKNNTLIGIDLDDNYFTDWLELIE